MSDGLIIEIDMWIGRRLTPSNTIANYTLREVQQQVNQWISQVGNGYWIPYEMLPRLVE